MTSLDSIPLIDDGKARTSPFDPFGEWPLSQLIERMIGEGFAMIVVLGERPNGLEDVYEWLEVRAGELQARLHKINLSKFTFNNPWLELDHTIGKLERRDRTILLLHGIDPKSEIKTGEDVRLFQIGRAHV